MLARLMCLDPLLCRFSFLLDGSSSSIALRKSTLELILVPSGPSSDSPVTAVDWCAALSKLWELSPLRISFECARLRRDRLLGSICALEGRIFELSDRDRLRSVIFRFCTLSEAPEETDDRKPPILPMWDRDRWFGSPGRLLLLDSELSTVAASSEASDALGWLDDLGLEGGMRKMGRLSDGMVAAPCKVSGEVMVPVETIFERRGNPWAAVAVLDFATLPASCLVLLSIGGSRVLASDSFRGAVAGVPDCVG